MSDAKVVTHQLHVIVHFAAAGEPFKDKSADPSETVGHLKARVLVAFGLAEGVDGQGNTVKYTLYHEKQAITDESVTLGSLAGPKHELQFRLNQQIVQGSTP